VRREPPPHRHPVPPHHRRERNRRIRACARRLSSRGEALAARARAGTLTVEDASLLDAFCDTLWLEDGLSKNTLEAYRHDLAQLALFLKARGLAQAGEADLFSFLASRKGRATSAARMLSSLKRFYQYCVRERHASADPTAPPPAIRTSQSRRSAALTHCLRSCAARSRPPSSCSRDPSRGGRSLRTACRRSRPRRTGAGVSRPREAGDEGTLVHVANAAAWRDAHASD